MRTVVRSAIVLGLALIVGLGLAVGTAGAWKPTKPIRIIVGYSPGGGTDVIARTVQSVAAEFLPVPLVVINKTGAAGTIAAKFVAGAKPDGYTLLVAGGSESTSVGHHRKLPYHPIKDFEPVIRFVRMRIIMNVRADSPWKTLKDLVRDAKANPGKYKFASAGHGSLYHSTMLVFTKKAGIEMKHVPYKGGAPGMAALMGGHVDVALSSADEARVLAAAGKIRSLALTSLDRAPQFPEVLTLKELGYDIFLENMKGFVAPKGTPPDRIQYLHDVFKRTMETKTFKRLAKRLKLELSYLDGPGFRKAMSDMYGQIGRVLQK